MIKLASNIETIISIISKEKGKKDDDVVETLVFEHLKNHINEYQEKKEVYDTLNRFIEDYLDSREEGRITLKDEDFIDDSEVDDYLSGKKSLD